MVVLAAYFYGLALLSARAKPTRSRDASDLFFVIVVPALNEAAVIGATLEGLLRLSGRFLILVVDDASDDRTVDAVAPFLADKRVRLLVRATDEARTGKGAVLNAAFDEIDAQKLGQQYGDDRVIVAVVDADGRVDQHLLYAVTPYFADRRTAGVQCAVRMHNASRNILTLWQNVEFIVWGGLFSKAKDVLGSSTLGGNGQFVRLSALATLGRAPWRLSLTEDLDLSLRLIERGWQLRFCDAAAVHQEALPNLPALIRQRTRWLQGHLVSWEHVPRLLRSPLPLRTRVDLVAFLLLPAAMLPIGISTVGSLVQLLADIGHWDPRDMLVWYVLGFATVPLVARALADDARSTSFIRLLPAAHAYVLYSAVWFVASVIAFWNIFAGHRAWSKTNRYISARHSAAATVSVSRRGARRG
jgi:cellulose synthase/poly-beta-1,6-N-acetylglucosamine synthase-like glycosyltransferase